MSRKGGGIVRGQSKEFLRVEVRAAGTGAAGKCARAQDPVDSTSHGNYFEEQKFRTPSAPPIAGEGDEVMFDAVESAETSGGLERTGLSSVADILAHYVHELPPSSNVHEHGVQMPYVENNLLSQILSFTINVQNAWQSFVAYDACFRLCLNAWARNCMEAPDSFGMSAWCCEVPFEMFTCTLELQSSCRGHQRESIPPQYLKPGIGESQLLLTWCWKRGKSEPELQFPWHCGMINQLELEAWWNVVAQKKKRMQHVLLAAALPFIPAMDKLFLLPISKQKA